MKSGKWLVLAVFILSESLTLIAQSEPDVEQGMKLYGSYHGGAIDQVSLTNQNLFLQAPLFSYSQRGGELAYPVVLRYNNKNYTTYQRPCPPGTKLGTTSCPLSLTVVFGANPLKNTPVSQGSSVSIGLGDFPGVASYGTGPGIDTGLSLQGQEIFVQSNSVITPDGSTHQLVKTDGGAAVLDGSGFSVSNSNLTSSQGTAFGTSVQDRNGNQINSTADTLGRSLLTVPGPTSPKAIPPTSTASLSACPALNYANQPVTFAYTWNLPTVNGGTLPLILCYAAVYVRTNYFNGATGPNYFDVNKSFTMLQSVVFADNNTYWAFEYDAADPNNTSSFGFGDLTKVTLPIGGSITYTWARRTSGLALAGVDRGVQTRTVDANDGTGPHTWHYTSDGVVTDPLGNDTVHGLTNLDGTSSWYETVRQYYQGSHTGGTLLKTVNTDYQWTSNLYDPVVIGGGVQSDANSVANVFPIHVTTTLPNGLTSRVETDYDMALSYHGPLDGITSNYLACSPQPDPLPPLCSWSSPTTNPVTNYTGSYGKVIAKREYDWGPNNKPGPLLRQTLTTYQWQVNSAYLTANLMNLPAVVKILDGSGNLCAETDYSYDEPGYLTTPTPVINTQHVTPTTVRGNLTTVTHKLSATPCLPNATWTSISSHTNWFDTGEVYQSTDPLGHTTTHTYDPSYAGAFPTQTCNALTQCVNGAYDLSTGLLTSLTDANGQTSNFAYDPRWRLAQALSPADPVTGLRPETDFDYSVVNQVKRTRGQTASDSIVDYAYFDGVGRTKQKRLVDPAGDDLVDTTYDAASLVSTVSNPHRSTSSQTDGITTITYDALGRVTQSTAQDGSISTADYSNFPTVTVTDPSGKMRRSRTDAVGRLVQIAEPGPGTNGPGTPGAGMITISGSLQISTSSGTKATGSISGGGAGTCSRPLICTDQCIRGPLTCDSGTVTLTVNGVTAQTIYNKNTTADGILSALAGQLSPHPTTYYDPGTGTITLTADQPGPNYSMSSTAVSSNQTYFPDPTVTVSVSGASLTGGVYPVTTYDSGTLTVTVGGFPASASYNQNLNNTPQLMAAALASALNASGSPVTASANGATINIVAKGGGTATNYTVAGGSSTSFTASSTTLSGATNPGGLYTPYVTNYSYDPLGNLLQVNQLGDGSQAARVRSFTYDSLSRLLTANNPESGTISYSYDADGNLVYKTSPQANQTGSATTTVTYCYDKLQRVTAKGYSNSPNSAQQCAPNPPYLPNPAATYTYDSGTNGIGHLASLTDQAGSGSYSYDPVGRMIGEARTISGVSKSMSYSYYLDGSLQTVTYPSRAVVTYTPDAAGHMLSAVDTGNSINYATDATYGPDGAITGFLSGKTGSFTGITNSFSYNQRLQPLNMSAASATAMVFSLNYDFHLGAGDNGNVWAIVNNKDNTRNQTFTYDQLNRLTSAQNAGTDCTQATVDGKTKFWGNSYGYDAWGNLLAKTVTKCSAESLSVMALANNQLSGYSYDAAGNMTYDATGALNYTYDQENRVTGANGFTYTYDGDGNRVAKSNGSTGTLYWYMLPGIVAESDLSGNLQSEYIFFDGERVARRDLPGGAVSYYFSDHLKTTDIVSDAQGNIKNESDFYPWGGELQFVANDSNHYKFTGKERNSETGLDQMGARYYSNALGRFISPDPLVIEMRRLKDPQMLNLYHYARNNPLTWTDGDGLDETLDCSKVSSAQCNQTITDLNNRQDAQFQVTRNDQTGLLQVKDQDKVDASTLSTSEGELFKAITDPGNHATLQLTPFSNAIDGDQYVKPGFNVLDRADLSQYGKANSALPGEIIAHAAVEAYAGVGEGRGDYTSAHNFANQFFGNVTLSDVRTLPAGAKMATSGVEKETFNRIGVGVNVQKVFFTPQPAKTVPGNWEHIRGNLIVTSTDGNK